ncbi:MAG: DUF2848 family protein [Pseudomonadota bacterium]
MLLFDVEGREVNVEVTGVVIAGWTGRNKEAVQHHIDELAAIGVAPPSTVPLFYRAARTQAVQSDSIEVLGGETSGEVEPVLVMTEDGLILTIGSDHTDRALEAHSVALSKQISAKPLGRSAWRFDVAADNDSIALSSMISNDGSIWTPYQDGTLAAIQPLSSLFAGAEQALDGFPVGTVMYCGTLPVLTPKITPSRFFKADIRRPDGATLALQYTAETLPIIV